jgi:hypothetical protein
MVTFSTDRSAFACLLITFLVSPVIGVASGAAVFGVLYFMMGSPSWAMALSGVVAALVTAGEFTGFRAKFYQGEGVTLGFLGSELLSKPVCFLTLTAIGAWSYGFLGKHLVPQLHDWGYEVQQKNEGLVVGFATLAVVTLTGALLVTYQGFRQGSGVRGRRPGVIASVRASLKKGRARRERKREGRILTQIHRDGGTSVLKPADLEFLKQRAANLRR